MWDGMWNHRVLEGHATHWAPPCVQPSECSPIPILWVFMEVSLHRLNLLHHWPLAITQPVASHPSLEIRGIGIKFSSFLLCHDVSGDQPHLEAI